MAEEEGIQRGCAGFLTDSSDGDVTHSLLAASESQLPGNHYRSSPDIIYPRVAIQHYLEALQLNPPEQSPPLDLASIPNS
jgi:hypothetical protein